MSEHNYLIISDAHIPYHYPGVIDFLRGVQQEFKCDKVLNVGDIIDEAAFSNWGVNGDLSSPIDELRIARGYLEEWYEVFPEMEITLGNHCIRHMRKALGAGLPSEVIRPMHDILRAPKGWNFHEVEYDAGEFIVTHGDFSRSSSLSMNTLQNMVLQRGKSMAIGHFHTRFGVTTVANRYSRLWGMVTGCLIDINSKAFSYDKKGIARPILGCGVVYKGNPMVIPVDLGHKSTIMTILPEEKWLNTIKSKLTYDQEKGVIINNFTGEVSGNLDPDGYVIITMCGSDRRKKTFKAHHLAWFLSFGEWPNSQIDHINGDKADNRLINLRLVDNSVQQLNRKPLGGTSKFRGVFKTPYDTYNVRVQIHGNRINLGNYKSELEAAIAYDRFILDNELVEHPLNILVRN